MKIHEISVKRPVAVVMVVLMFVVIGLYSVTMLPMELTPDMEMPMALVATSYPNVGSEEVENLVTKPIESSVASVSGAKSTTSQSTEGSSIVMVEFSNGTDMDKAVSDMESNINLVKSALPDDANDPMVFKLDMNMMPIAMMSVSYEGYDLVQTKRYVEDNLENKLEAIDGIASVTVTGAQDREIDVYIDPTRLAGYNMSLTDVSNAIAAQNQNLPAGSTSSRGKDLSSRVIGKFSSVQEIEKIPLTTPQGSIIYLRDIAEIRDTYSEDETYARLNQIEAISISISKESDANTVDVVDAVYQTLDGLSAQNPKFSYNMTMEQGTQIKEAVHNVAQNAVLGGVLAVIVLLLFLGSVKTSLVIGISMPISIITTFIGMFFSGMSLNVVSLGGLALGVGMLVDNAVVVLENIFRRRKLDKSPAEASIRGAGEVIGAVVASVLTTCIVYVPILFVDNMMAIMFKQLAFTIIFSQTASLLTTFLLVPMLSSKIKNAQPAKGSRLAKILSPFNKLLGLFYRVYEKALRWVLSHRKIFILGVAGVFVLTIISLTQIGMTLMDAGDQGMISISISMPKGSQLETTNELTRKIEGIVMENPCIETVFSRVGSGGMSGALTGASASDSADITITLVDEKKRKQSTEDVVQELRDALSDISGAEIELEASSQGGMSMSANEIEFEFTGANSDEELENYVLECEKAMKGIDGVVETSTSISDTVSEIHIRPNRNKAQTYGMTPASQSVLIKGILEGVTASKYMEDGSEYDIVVKYPDDYADTYHKLKNLQIKTQTGAWVTLDDIADVSIDEGPSTLTRVDQKRTLTVTGKLYGTDMSSANRAFMKATADIPKPEGVSTVATGSFETMQEAMSQLLLAILLGIVLMYMIMAAQFESIIQPVIILVTIPLALIGVVLALLVTNTDLSAVGMIGMLMLVGIIVNNAIVLIDFINTSRQENPDGDRTDQVVNAGITRMRPVLMTSLTSILGFLPMAVSTSGSSAMMAPLAIVLIGGLFVGTFLTLLVIPTVYTIVDDKQIKRRQKKERKSRKRLSKKEAL